MEYDEALEELREEYAETRDPELRRELYAALAQMREAIDHLSREEDR